MFKTTETLGRILTKVKDPTPPEERPDIVYKIKCICGDFYIGETGRSLTARIKEHKEACRLPAFERSAVAEHAWQARGEWDDVEILDTATDLQERKVKEVVYIKLSPKGLKINRDEGKELSPLWIRTIIQAQKKPPYQPHPPERTMAKRQQATAQSQTTGSCHVTGSTTTDSPPKDCHQQSGDLLHP